MSLERAKTEPSADLRELAAPASFRIYAIVLLLGAVGTLALTRLSTGVAWDIEPTFIAWVLAVALAGALPIRTENGVSLAFDLPILLAAGFVLGPGPAGLAALLGSLDWKDLRRRGSIWLPIYNRAQTALAAMASALVFHSMVQGQWTWPSVGFAALLGLSADIAVNFSLVAAGVAMFRRLRVLDALSFLHIGPGRSFALEYGCFGLLGLVLAVMYSVVGIPALVLFVIPIVISNQMFRLRQRGEVVGKALEEKVRAIRSITEKVADERRDERLAVAGELHDEVLPPLFKVHLMGQVIRQDLASGRLLDLDHDVPDLLAATDAAQRAVRGVVSSLRHSPLGLAGLTAAIRLLAAQLEEAGGPRISLDLGQVAASEHAQLLAYQVVREAAVNAATHANASEVSVSVYSDGEFLRVVVGDDGAGFAPARVDRASHFGLEIMRERVESAGGRIIVDSQLGRGTCVTAALPSDA